MPGLPAEPQPPATTLCLPAQCVAGYHGVNCSEEINECLSHPCQNGGTCIDLTNTYKCSCPRGTQGKGAAPTGGSGQSGHSGTLWPARDTLDPAAMQVPG